MSARLPRVIYEVFEAKIHSENAYIGEPTDAFILFRTGTAHLSPDTKDRLRAEMDRYDKMPLDALAGALAAYEKAPGGKSEVDVGVPEEWSREFVEDKLGPVLKQIKFAQDNPEQAASMRPIGAEITNEVRFNVGTPQGSTRYSGLAAGTPTSQVMPTTPSSAPIESVPPSSQLPNDEKR